MQRLICLTFHRFALKVTPRKGGRGFTCNGEPLPVSFWVNVAYVFSGAVGAAIFSAGQLRWHCCS